MDNYSKKILSAYLNREYGRASKAHEILQCAESGARLHEIENVNAVLESLMENLDKPVEFKVELLNSKAKIPEKANPSDAGWDLTSSENLYVYPSATVAIPTGVRLELSEGWEAQIRSRSGLSLRGLTVANSPGTIDSGYRGEIMVIVANSSPLVISIKEGQKIAQLVFQRVEKVQLTQVEKVDTNTDRSTAGFGSTDKRTTK